MNLFFAGPFEHILIGMVVDFNVRMQIVLTTEVRWFKMQNEMKYDSEEVIPLFLAWNLKRIPIAENEKRFTRYCKLAHPTRGIEGHARAILMLSTCCRFPREHISVMAFFSFLFVCFGYLPIHEFTFAFYYENIDSVYTFLVDQTHGKHSHACEKSGI